MLQNIITLLPHYSEEHFSVFTSNLSRRTIVCSFLFYNKQTSKKTTWKKLSGYEKCGVWCKWLSNDGGVGGGGGADEVTPEVCEGWQSAAGTSPSWLRLPLQLSDTVHMIKRSSAPIRNKSAFLCESHSVFTPHYSVQVPATLHHVINSKS